MHEDAPAKEEEPEAQGEQEDAPLAAYVLTAQVVQEAAVPPVEYEPPAHAAQPLPEMMEPLAHTKGVQTVAPVSDAVPAGQGEHRFAPL